MCGRYVSVAHRADLQQLYGATGPGDDKELAPSWNVAPTNKVYAVVQRDREDGAGTVREVRAVRWGLVPAWWKPGIDPKTNKEKTMPTLHNARADRVATAPSWRGPFAKRRAVIPAAGYYEWLPSEDADGKPFKQPYYIHPADGVLSFAGLYELWPDPTKDAGALTPARPRVPSDRGHAPLVAHAGRPVHHRPGHGRTRRRVPHLARR